MDLEALMQYADNSVALALAVAGLIYFGKRLEKVLEKMMATIERFGEKIDNNSEAQNATATAVLRLLENQGYTDRATTLSKEIHHVKNG